MLSEPRDRHVVIAGRCAETLFRQRLALAKAARAAGWRVTMIGQDNGAAYIAALRAEGLEFQAIDFDQASLSPVSLARSTIAAARFFRRTRPRVVHGFNIKPVIASMIAARFAGVPRRLATIAGLGHIFLSGRHVVRALGIALYRLALGRAHRIYFYNSADRDLFVERRIVSSARSALVDGSGVDTSRFTVVAQPNGERFRVIFIGRLLREKGVAELLQAGDLLAGRRLPITILLVGDVDPNNPSSLTTEMVRSAASNGVVEWLGPAEDVAPLLATADAVVLPSYREGVPLALLEGAAMGRALIATEVPGCRDVVIDGDTGLLVPARDAASLAGAIAKLASDRALAAKFGRAARALVERRFASDVVNPAMVAEYDRAFEPR